LYSSGATPEQLRVDKERAFETLRREYEAMKTSWQGNTDYDAWFAQPLNNATLASVATYTRWLPAMRSHVEDVGVQAFYADAAEIAELDATQREERLRAWEAKGRAPDGASGEASASG
jgi:predicted aminopeptidase